MTAPHGFRIASYPQHDDAGELEGYAWFAAYASERREGESRTRADALRDAVSALREMMPDETQPQLCARCHSPVKTGERCACEVIR